MCYNSCSKVSYVYETTLLTTASVLRDDVIKWDAFYALLALYEGNPPVTGGFPSQRPVTWRIDILFDAPLNKQLRKQSRCRWFETLLWSFWRHCNEYTSFNWFDYTSILEISTVCILFTVTVRVWGKGTKVNSTRKYSVSSDVRLHWIRWRSQKCGHSIYCRNWWLSSLASSAK